jgi:hypothetical protein
MARLLYVSPRRHHAHYQSPQTSQRRHALHGDHPHAPRCGDQRAGRVNNGENGLHECEVRCYLVRETHDECQSDVESADVIVVEMPDLPPDSFAPNRHRFIGHHLRPHS